MDAAGVAHAPVEVAVGGAQAHLAVGRMPSWMPTPGAAAGVGDDGAGLPDTSNRPSRAAACATARDARCDDEAGVGGTMTATQQRAQQRSSRAAVGAGPDERPGVKSLII